MRYTKYKWMMWLVLLCFSCVNDEQRAVLSDEPGKVRMNMSISTRATYDPEVLNENETRINRLRLYVFDGSTLDKMYYWSDLNINDGVYVTPIFLVKAATGKTFYAIVNEPTDMDSRALLEAVDHPGDLAEIQYRRRDIMDYWNPNIMGYYNDYCLPMYGELTGVDALEGTTQTINLQVDRAVARVDVYMRREIGQDENYWENRLYIEELGVDRISDIGFISPVRVPDNRYDNIYFMDRKEIREEVYSDDKGELLYSFYVSEMECIYDKLSLDFHYRYETGYDDYARVELGGYNNYPQGEILEKIERNHVYKLFCRFTQKIAKFELNLTVCPWEYLPPQAEEVKGEVKMTNCYMVAPGGRVDIPTENVYKIWAQQAEFGNIPIPDGDVTAELVWQDEQGVIADEGVTVVNASERERAYLQVRTAKEGNAVVAMKVNGEIYWSWHIWCTDYEPNVTEGQKFFNNLVWMDRNLGAMTNEYTIDGGVKGLFYQWGRKDPLIGPSSENATSIAVVYDIDNNTIEPTDWATTTTPITRDDIAKYPMTIYGGASGISENWFAEDACDLWGSSVMYAVDGAEGKGAGEKSIYDPCPPGYRVPHPYVWSTFTSEPGGGKHKTAGFTTTIDGGIKTLQNTTGATFSSTYVYPATGFIAYTASFATGPALQRLSKGLANVGINNWSNAANAANRGARFFFDNGGCSTPAGNPRAYGYCVRCMKDTK